MNWGGKRSGAGRKPKDAELQLIESLKPYDAIALNALEKGLKEGKLGYLRLFMEYRYGKPIQIQGDFEQDVQDVNIRIINNREEWEQVQKERANE